MRHNWKKVKLGEAPLEIIDGDRGNNYPNQSEFFEDEYCLFLNAGNVTSNGFDFKVNNFITKQKDELLRKGKIKRFDSILTTRGTLGNIGFYNENIPYENMRINSGMVILRTDVLELFPEYLYNVVRSIKFQNQIKSFSTGSAQPQLPIRDIRKLNLSLPPLVEQKAIARILGSLDDKIELNRQMNRTLEEMAQAIFKAWFVDFLPFQDGNFVNSELGLIPEGWKVVALGEIIEIGSSKRIFASEYKNNGIPFYRGKEITELSKGNSVSSEIFISKQRFLELVQTSGVPKEYDILLTSVGTIGNAYLIQKDDQIYFKDGNLTWIKKFKKHLDAFFIYVWLNSNNAKISIDKIKIGSTQQAITIASLKTIKLIIPSEGHYKLIKPFLKRNIKLRQSNQKEIETLTQTRDTLLPKLVSGELRV